MFRSQRVLPVSLLLVAGTLSGYGFSLLQSSWPAGSTVALELQLGAAPFALRDGSPTYDASARSALNLWNAAAVKVQLAPGTAGAPSPAQGDGLNSVFFSDTVFGAPFGAQTLAVTVILSDDSTTTETDVIFNQAVAWDSYVGPLPDNAVDPMDIRRVALHEFGHVLGLGHADRAGEFVHAIMHSLVSNLSQLTPDDIAGLDSRYGARFTSPAAVTAVVGEPFVFQIALDTPGNLSLSYWPSELSFNSQTGLLSGIPVEDRVLDLTTSAYIKNYSRQISQPLRLTVLPRQRDFPTFLDYTQVSRSYNSRSHFYIGPESGLKVVLNQFNRVVVFSGTAGPVIEFGAAGGKSLTAGTYAGAIGGSHVNDPNRHTLDVRGPQQCDNGTGSFLIKELTYGAKETITSFWATFEQECASGLRIVNSGEVRFHVDASDPRPVPFVTAPAEVSGKQGEALSFQASSGPGSITYDSYGLPTGVSINFYTGVVSGTPKFGGTFRAKIFATDSTGASGQALVTLNIASRPAPRHSLLNISTRARGGTGDDVTIAGFIVKGSAQKGVLLRVLGPSLSASGIPAGKVLVDPELTFNGVGYVRFVDDWLPVPAGSNGAWWEVAGTGLAPADRVEPAAYQLLNPGAYTVVVRGKNSGTGIGLTEVYDMDPTSSSLANISTRAKVGLGDDVLIGGFIIGGGEPTKVIIRAIGPSLRESGVAAPLLDPTVALHDGNGAQIALNDDWRGDQTEEIGASALAPADHRESAIVRTLSPGNYTAIVRGKDESTGIALVEIYNLAE